MEGSEEREWRVVRRGSGGQRGEGVEGSEEREWRAARRESGGQRGEGVVWRAVRRGQ